MLKDDRAVNISSRRARFTENKNFPIVTCLVRWGNFGAKTGEEKILSSQAMRVGVAKNL